MFIQFRPSVFVLYGFFDRKCPCGAGRPRIFRCNNSYCRYSTGSSYVLHRQINSRQYGWRADVSSFRLFSSRSQQDLSLIGSNGAEQGGHILEPDSLDGRLHADNKSDAQNSVRVDIERGDAVYAVGYMAGVLSSTAAQPRDLIARLILSVTYANEFEGDIIQYHLRCASDCGCT